MTNKQLKPVYFSNFITDAGKRNYGWKFAVYSHRADFKTYFAKNSYRSQAPFSKRVMINGVTLPAIYVPNKQITMLPHWEGDKTKILPLKP